MLAFAPIAAATALRKLRRRAENGIKSDTESETTPTTAAPTNGFADGAGIPIWHVVISGFTQTLEHPSGCQNLWNQVQRINCEEAATRLDPWNSDWPGVAELIWRFRPADRPPLVFCFAYSWGGGWGFPRLAAELEKRGIEIAHAVLCDAVYRPHCRLFLAASLLPTSRIVVPPNVHEVSWFFQREGLPMGHQVVAADPRRTVVHPGRQVFGVTHHYMDDQACWWWKCLEVAKAAAPEYV